MLMLYWVILQPAGYSIVTAQKASEAKYLFLKYDLEIILLDLGLPDQCGLELLSDFLIGKPSIRIIVSAANGFINKAVKPRV